MPVNKRANVYLMIQSAHTRIESADPKSEPSFQALSVVNTVDLVCHLWQHYVNVALFPLATASVTIRREMSVFNNQAVSRVEGASNNLLQRLIDGEFDLDLHAWHSQTFGSHRLLVVSATRETEKERL